jgi:hypothetical protein
MNLWDVSEKSIAVVDLQDICPTQDTGPTH